jgi:hypothetical protein
MHFCAVLFRNLGLRVLIFLLKYSIALENNDIPFDNNQKCKTPVATASFS